MKTIGFVLALVGGICWGRIAARGDIIVSGDARSRGIKAGVPELDRAVSAYQSGDLAGAAALFEKMRETQPGLARGKVLVARFCLIDGRDQEARPFLEAAAVDYPDDPEAYILLAEAALRSGRIAEAVLCLERAQENLAASQAPEAIKTSLRIDYLKGMAYIAEGRGDWSRAREALAEWVKLEPKSTEAHQRLARAVLRLGEADAALAGLESAPFEPASGWHPALVMSALAGELGDAEKTRGWYERAIRERPNEAQPHLRFATWLLDEGKLDEAATHANEALRIDPNALETRVVVGLVALDSGDYSKAEHLFERLHVENPGKFSPNSFWARALAFQKDPIKRENALNIALAEARIDPRSSAAFNTLAFVHQMRGEDEQAARILDELFQQNRATAESAYLRGQICEAAKETERAIKLYRIAIETPGDFRLRHDARARLKALQK